MKAFRRIWSVITTIVVILIVFLAIALVGVRVIGLTPYTVLSGSMEPTYHVGSLIYVKEAEPAEIEVGDPITFVVNEDLLVATHRVVEIDVQTSRQQAIVDETGEAMLDAEGNPIYEEVPLDEPAYYFTTKGDANDAVDGAQVYYKNLLGVPVFTIPYLGYLSNWIQTKKGMIISINVALILLLLTFLPDLLRSVDDAPKKKKKRRKRPA
ncbi:MAG: signal peptidase I [Clostridia bacterium]|nr:signal peptidase I [Clostridia bacterium]